MPGMKVKAGIAGMVMIAGSMIITTQPNNEAQAASCPNLPEVSWWKTNHDKIVDYVEQRYKGEWEPYLNKWRDYKNKMRAIYEKNGTAIVKSRGIRLRGASLMHHSTHQSTPGCSGPDVVNGFGQVSGPPSHVKELPTLLCGGKSNLETLLLVP